MKPFHFVTVCGSLRSGSFNAALLRVAEAELVRLGGTFDRYDEIREIPPYDEDLDTDPPPLICELRAAVVASDGVLSASPAYNGAITGASKDWVDWMSRPFGHWALGGKHVGIITASIGPNGGGAAAEYLQRINRAMKANVISPVVSVGSVHSTLDESAMLDGATTSLVNELAQSLLITKSGAEVSDSLDRQRYELVIDDEVVAYCTYDVVVAGDVTVIDLLQVVTEDDHRERGLDSFLTRTVLDTIAATEGGLVIPSCPFVASYIDPRAQYQSLVAV